MILSAERSNARLRLKAFTFHTLDAQGCSCGRQSYLTFFGNDRTEKWF